MSKSGLALLLCILYIQESYGGILLTTPEPEGESTPTPEAEYNNNGTDKSKMITMGIPLAETTKPIEIEGSAEGSGSVAVEPASGSACKVDIFRRREFLSQTPGSEYSFSFQHDDDNLTFSIVVPGKAEWFAIGFPPFNTNNGTGMTVFQVQGIGVIMTDMTDDVEEPKFELLRGCKGEAESGEKIQTVTLTRRLDTCRSQDVPIPRGSVQVAHAVSMSPLSGSKLTLQEYETASKGVNTLNLLNNINSKEEAILTPVNSFSLTVTGDDTWDVTKPYCEFVELPIFETTQKIFQYQVRTEGVVGSAGIQEMILYQCGNRLWQGKLGTPFDCSSENKPIDADQCDEIILDWVGGYPVFTYPENTGYWLSGLRAASYAMIKIKASNFVPEYAGFYILHEPSTPDYTASGVTEVSVLSHSTNAIPPGSNAFVTQGHCMDSCLDNAMNDSSTTEINIFSVSMYSGSYGTKLQLRHYRNGTELRPIALNSQYSYKYGEKEVLSKPVVVKYGDYLIMECTYDTTNADNMTYGGPGEGEERCGAYISYYPKLYLTTCSSVPVEKSLMGKYKKANFEEVNEYISNEVWDDTKREDFNKMMLESDVYVQCSKGMRGYYMPKNTIKSHPIFNDTYIAPSTCGASGVFNTLALTLASILTAYVLQF